MTDEKKIRLRKLNDPEIYGPMSMPELKQLANTAYISPEDEIAFEEEEWSPAIECEDLEMVWTIQSDDGVSYGPTTAGTIKEFLIAGEIQHGDKLVHARTGEVKSIEEVLGDEALKEAAAEIAEAEEGFPEEGLTESMEIAKDLRIRNLETELEGAKKENDELKQKYLQVCEELTNLKKAE